MAWIEVVEILTERTQSTTREENDPLQLLVEEEVVEVPDVAVVAKGVGVHIGVVGEDVAFQEGYLLIESDP